MTYKISDYNGKEIKGFVYEQELQKTKQDIFKIDIQDRKNNKATRK